ncbi:hypothetical protein AVEN_121035-2 [Araneus ventricosus]|uniref:Uncharacterized protein n=1 Tax=Araneus ventricosus TaxID=182803 RepID=A0A4Y2F2F8_ARAVE|nr:hypothetical protein AVEN_121035-2 [Araneus ventricosus]
MLEAEQGIEFAFCNDVCIARYAMVYARVLNEFILHFEPVFFDQHSLKDQHRRFIRSPMDRYFTLQFAAFKRFVCTSFTHQFAAFKRVFRLKLKRDSWVFAENTKFENSNSTVHYDKARVISGYVEGIEMVQLYIFCVLEIENFRGKKLSSDPVPLSQHGFLFFRGSDLSVL